MKFVLFWVSYRNLSFLQLFNFIDFVPEANLWGYSKKLGLADAMFSFARD